MFFDFTPEHVQVSIGYLLSTEFAELAMHRTGKDDPSFIDACRTAVVPLEAVLKF